METSPKTDLQGKRVLITGATGFIGANLTRELVRRGAEVSVFVRPDSQLWRVSDIISEIRLFNADLLDVGSLVAGIDKIRPEIIFHLAAQGVAQSEKDRSEIIGTNVIGTYNLLEALRPVEFKRFVHMGGSSEYGINKSPMKETDCLAPVTFYGATKAAASLLCCQFAKTSGKPIIVLRPFSVYGYWESGRRLVPSVIMAALCRRHVALTPPGYRRDFVFVADVIEACLLCVVADNLNGEIINIGTGHQWSNEEVVEMVQTLSGREISCGIGEYAPHPADTASWVGDVLKARQMLGWQPAHSLKEGLAKTISWLQQHLDDYLARYPYAKD